MEKKYIESDMAVQVLQDAIKRYPDSYYNGLVVAKNLIFNLPAADVVSRDEGIKMEAELAAQDLDRAFFAGVEEGMRKRDVRPVTHGKWIKMRFFTYFECSACCKCNELATDFCPNCGAVMEES